MTHKTLTNYNIYIFLSLNILPCLFFNEYLREAKQSALFTQEGLQEGEKHCFINMHEQNVIGSQTQLNDIVYEQTVISRQLFASHIVDSRPMKRKKNLY